MFVALQNEWDFRIDAQRVCLQILKAKRLFRTNGTLDVMLNKFAINSKGL